MATLEKIHEKIRRKTRAVSESQMTSAEIDDYVNTYVLYDLPETMRTFNLRKKFTFYTEPYIDSYTTGTTAELANFKNRKLTVHPPFYVDGTEANFTLSREEFYATWPQTKYVNNLGTGNGIVINFVGVIPGAPLLRKSVTITSISGINDGQVLYETGQGLFMGDGIGVINYETGAYDVDFLVAPGAGNAVESHAYPYEPNRPTCVLFFEDTFVLRPIPDKVYTVEFEVNVRPTEFLGLAVNPNQAPDLEELWQLIALGACKKIFEDRGDYESLGNMMPELEEQKTLMQRRTIVQLTLDQRAQNIFTEGARNIRWPFSQY